jgi:hypothetical protein
MMMAPVLQVLDCSGTESFALISSGVSGSALVNSSWQFGHLNSLTSMVSPHMGHVLVFAPQYAISVGCSIWTFAGDGTFLQPYVAQPPIRSQHAS